MPSALGGGTQLWRVDQTRRRSNLCFRTRSQSCVPPVTNPSARVTMHAMRIIAGKYRRRKLLSNPGETTRPITDRAKESLFQNIEHWLEDKKVADIFAGTGSLGLEALSRGASGAIMIEKDLSAFELLKQNVAMLGIEEIALCWRADVFRCSFKPTGVPHLTPLDVIFFDPPYKMAKEISPGRPLYQALLRLAKSNVSSVQARLLYRISEFEEYEFPSCWQMIEEMKISKMKIIVFEKTGEPQESTESESNVS